MMCFRVGRVDHHSLFFAVFGRQADHHPSEDTFRAPTLPPAIKRLVRSVFFGGATPPQPIAIDKYNPAQNTSVIHTELAM